MRKAKEKGLSISFKSFLGAIITIFVLMALCYALTFILPSGSYQRDAEGKIIESSFTELDKTNFPFYKWILSPFLLLGSSTGLTTIVIILFLLIIGGVFNVLTSFGIMEYLVERVSYKFSDRKYLLLSLITLCFMVLGALIGTFEEVVPLVPVVVALSIGLGWDALTGIGMSLLAIGFGFSTGVFNPFTVGVAQSYANLPVFSGVWLRLVSFVLIYFLLTLFLILHAKKIEKKTESKPLVDFKKNKKFDKALAFFTVTMFLGIVLITVCCRIDKLKDYTTIIILIVFLVAGILSSIAAGIKIKEFLRLFFKGAFNILPAVLLILMAASIRFILEESNRLDVILKAMISVTEGLSPLSVILIIYLFVLIMNFFIASGSAKAAMIIPLIVPIAEKFGISSQLCILAFLFGDGFSNVFYPTNPVLLIGLGLTDVSYGKWVKYSWVLQILVLLITSGILIFGFLVGYH